MIFASFAHYVFFFTTKCIIDIQCSSIVKQWGSLGHVILLMYYFIFFPSKALFYDTHLSCSNYFIAVVEKMYIYLHVCNLNEHLNIMHCDTFTQFIGTCSKQIVCQYRQSLPKPILLLAL